MPASPPAAAPAPAVLRDRLAAILAPLAAPEAPFAAYAAAARQLEREIAPHAAAAGLRPVRAFLARSVTVEPWLPFLCVEAVRAGFWLAITVGGYGSFIDELMNPHGALHSAAPDVVLFLPDREDVAGQLRSLCAAGDGPAVVRETESAAQGLEDLLTACRRYSPRARLLVQGLVLPPEPALGAVADANQGNGEAWAVSQLNHRLATVCRRLGDAVFFDQDALAAAHGRATWRDERMFRFSRVAVAAPRFPAYAAALVRCLRALYFPPRKVLCTDLDNVLWGGILGEDLAAGIATGAAFPGNCYHEYQLQLRHLAARGVLLAIVSKNDAADVREAFARRRADLALGLEDFCAVKIGWEDKAASLRALAAELSLGLDSFVFVDDSPVECEAVRRQLPEVLVLQAPATEPWRLAPMLAACPAFDTLAITAEDRRRGQDYQAQSRRAALQQSAASREDFLASLQMVCEIVPAADAPMARAVQLTQKTNQFNLTTRRYAAAEIERLAQSPGGIALAIRLRDRFGDAGVVGLALCRTEGADCRIDTFLLSCRVIGRGVETALLWRLARQAQAQGARRLVGEFLPTAKNAPCASFYADHGFRSAGATADGAGRLYHFDLTAAIPPHPAWIQLGPASGAA